MPRCQVKEFLGFCTHTMSRATYRYISNKTDFSTLWNDLPPLSMSVGSAAVPGRHLQSHVSVPEERQRSLLCQDGLQSSLGGSRGQGTYCVLSCLSDFAASILSALTLGHPDPYSGTIHRTPQHKDTVVCDFEHM